MVTSWDTSDSNPGPTPPTAADTVQAPGQEPATLPPGMPTSAGRDLAGPGLTATLADLPLGRRVAAAIVDLAVLSGLYVIMSILVGQTSPAIGPVNVYLGGVTFTSSAGAVFRIGLNGAWAILYLILLAAYYFASETLAGQTAGKALLGLRVLRQDGAPATGGQIAVRTLLRLIDELPAFYLAGFIVMLVTGRHRRQRLGDMGAGTIVVRAARSPWSVALALASVVLVVLATAGLSSARLTSPAGSQTFRGHGISFSYPAGWEQGHSTNMEQAGNRSWNLAVGPGSDTDVVTIESFRLTKAVGTGNLGPVTGELRRMIQGWLKQNGGAILRGPHRARLSTMPGVRFLVGSYLPDGRPFQSTLTFGFTGTTEYLINCQATRSGQAAISAGCDQVVSTFRTTAPPVAQTPTAPPATQPPPPLDAAQWRHGLRLLLGQMNRALGGSGVVTRAYLRAQAGQLQRCAPGLAGLGKPPPQLRRADRLAVRACAQFTRAARYYAAAARAFDPYKTTERFSRSLHRGDAAVNAGSDLLAEAVVASLPG